MRPRGRTPGLWCCGIRLRRRRGCGFAETIRWPMKLGVPRRRGIRLVAWRRVLSVQRWVRNLATRRLAVQHFPSSRAALERIGHLHGGAFLLGAEEHLRLRMVPVHRNLLHSNVHRSQIDAAVLAEMLQDAGANCIFFRGGSLAGNAPRDRCAQRQQKPVRLHASDLSRFTASNRFTIFRPLRFKNPSGD